MCIDLLCQLYVNFEPNEAILRALYRERHCPSRFKYGPMLPVPLRNVFCLDFTSKRWRGGGDESIDGFDGVLCLLVGGFTLHF